MPSGRAIHQAARAELDARWFRDWCRRAPYLWLHERFVRAVDQLAAWPEPHAYDALARLVPCGEVERPRFVAQDRDALRLAGGYEQHVTRQRAVPTRPQSWHDFFNMVVWAHFPRVRWALNAVHVDASLGPIDPRNGRAREQNVASQLDESGLIVASSSSELLHELRELRFKRAFWERRAELVATSQFWIVGHGTLESLLTPHLGLASKAVLLELPRPPRSYDPDELRCAIDARVAGLITGWRGTVPVLNPIPLLGIPDYADNADAAFYDDAQYFRFERRPAVAR